MPLMDNLKRGVDTARFKADQVMRVNRVQGEIGNLRRDIQGVREKIANVVVELHAQKTLAHPELEELCGTIDQFEAQIAEKEELIVAIKAEEPPQAPAPTPPVYAPSPAPGSVGTCPNCRANVPVGAAFCTHCGQPMPKPEPAHTAPAQSPTSIRCPNCEFALPAEAAFCVNCGKPVSESPTSAAATPGSGDEISLPDVATGIGTVAVENFLEDEPSDAEGNIAADDAAAASSKPCPGCGFSLPAEAAFCTNCGVRLSQPEAAASAPVSLPGIDDVSRVTPESASASDMMALAIVEESSAESPVAESPIIPSSVERECANCGFSLPVEAAFCTNCGTRVVAAS